MTNKDTIKKQIRQVLTDKYQADGLDFNVNYPPLPEMGDYATNVALVIGKELRKNPLTIANELMNNLGKNKMWNKVTVAKPGFVNFFLNQNWLTAQLGIILKQGKKYGNSNEGKGKTVVIDYSAPNIAKKMHVGHLRSTVIGAAICNLHKFLGYKVIGDNHLGDWGTQFGKLIFQYKKIYGETIKKNITVEEMEKLYLDFHQEAKERPEMEAVARKELKKLQDHEKFNYRLWQLFYRVSMTEFKKVYDLLGVKFETWHGESFYHKMLPGVIAEALKKGVAEKSQGALIVNLEKYGLPPLLIKKTDGAYLYSTSDLATIKYRHEKYSPTKNLYVVANQQCLYFEQLFKTSELLGYHDKEEMMHIKFGLILGKGGKKMSTREGEVADLVEIINEGIEKAKVRIKIKNKNLSKIELEKTAKIIALGAIKYNDLSQNRLTDIIFDWDKMLNFESGSAPYLQYTYVRVKSIFKKSKDQKIKRSNYKLLKEQAEIKLMKDLINFPEAVRAAAEEYKPNIVALHLDKLAADFHSYYEQVPILKADEKIRRARLDLIRAVAQVIKIGLELLGVKTPEKM